MVVVDEASQVRVAEASVPASMVAADGRLVLAGDDLQLPPIVQGVYPEADSGEPLLHRSVFESVRCQVPPGSPVVRMLLENRRMNDVLTSVAASLLYGPEYRCFDASVAARRIALRPDVTLSPFAAACLAPEHPLVVVVLDGVQAGASSPVEAALVADLVVALRDGLADAGGAPYPTDAAFFSRGLFVVSPHRAQIRAIRHELRARREWASPPFVDTVDKIQGQEAECVVVSYGVSDPEAAVREADFIYGVQRLNVSVTRARAKTVLFLPRPLVDGSPQVLESDDAARGLAMMQGLVRAAERQGSPLAFTMPGGVTAQLYFLRRMVDAGAASPKLSYLLT
jgi:superfamily I DNA and/or RNA helicase